MDPRRSSRQPAPPSDRDREPQRRTAASSSTTSSSRRSEPPASASSSRPARTPASSTATSSSNRPPQPPPAEYDADGPAPPEPEPDEYDLNEDGRDVELAQHWDDWDKDQNIERDSTYPVIIDDGVAAAVFQVLGGRPPQIHTMKRVPRLGDGLGLKKLGDVKVVLVNGDDQDLIKSQFRGKRAAVVMGKAERSAFRPTAQRGSGSGSAAQQPAELPLRGGPPPPSQSRDSSSRQDGDRGPRREEPRREESRREESRREAPRGERERRREGGEKRGEGGDRQREPRREERRR
ncbi:hypothetical protein BT67DRAFT_159594 [Trichocladium antarcticum]|uniref:Uncharacterized protein n=1 Tax=Trichocladium antarcticum TaxID=1450529 RepID=A0AAN6UEF2_9PEZI|nr:hypothetical protein BT67DRAFT_159594 [Trichocladium antarcticum]